MNKDFPFTKYDFYAYLASGLMVLLFVDRIFGNSAYLINRADWGFVAGAMAVSLAYITGQIIAIPSSLILEHLLFKAVLRSPIVLQVGIKKPRFHEKVLSALVGRYYGPLPENVGSKIKSKARNILKMKDEDPDVSAEALFQVAFVEARKNEDTRNRMDDFRDQYGFSRNIAFIALMVFCMSLMKHSIPNAIEVGALVVFITMFVRFLKFYSSFQAEILRTFAFASEEK